MSLAPSTLAAVGATRLMATRRCGPGISQNEVIMTLGDSVLNRDVRHSSDISHLNSQVEKLQAKLLTSNVIWIIVLGVWVGWKW